MTTWKKSIQNNPDTWLDWIINGQKTYEGRVFHKDWTQMQIGDKIHFCSHDKEAVCVVTEFKKYQNFLQAFEELRDKLVPIPNVTGEKVVEIYDKLLGTDNIINYGVIVIGIKLC